MLKNSFFKTIPFLLFSVLLISCDKEFNVIGEDLIDNNSFGISKDEYPVVAYNQKLTAIQSNDLEVNAFGIYENPSFGTTRANFVSQVVLATPGVTIDKTAIIKKVVLTIPYFVDKTKTKLDNATGVTTYELDSIYGSPEKSKMKLSIYESGYFMRDLDPAEQFLQPQKFYNDQYAEFYSQIIPLASTIPYLNDSSAPAQNVEFFFDPAEHEDVTVVDGKEVTTRTPPGMELNLNNAFFQEKLFGTKGAPAGSLATNEVFKNYFRGLFFNIEAINGNPGNLAMMKFGAGKITVTYTETIDSKTVDKAMIIELKGNTVSLLDESNINSNYEMATKEANVDKVNGDPNLYLKGGAGSLSVLKLFSSVDKHGFELTDGPNGVSDELDDLRRNKYLINQADLTIHLNSVAMGTSYVPQRVYLYDFKNSKVLIDYEATSPVVSNPKYSKFIFGGLLTKKSEADGGSYYKFRITEHIRNLVKNSDSTNVDLGLVVTEDITKSSFYTLKNKTGFPLKAPMASVMNPLGAILFGNNIPIDDKNYNKRLKFEIYYTKPN
jgi:hypothetical protein